MKAGGGTMPQDVLERMEKAGIIPIVVIEDPSKAVQLGRTVLDAGLDLIEITMRTPKAMEAIRALSKELPEMLVGAGTVFSVPVAKEALSAGARFIVSPHLDEEIVAYCASKEDRVRSRGLHAIGGSKGDKGCDERHATKKHQGSSFGDQDFSSFNRRPRPHNGNESRISGCEVSASWGSQRRKPG